MGTVPPNFEQLLNASETSLRAIIDSSADGVVRQAEAAIRAAQGALAAQTEQGFKEILAKIKAKDSRIWQFAMALVPTLATAFLGWLVFHLQIQTNAKIDLASKQLSTRLALSQQFYQERFNVYEDADRQMVQLLTAINNIDRNPHNLGTKSQADMLLIQLNLSSRTNGFYMTPAVSKGLANVWSVATDLPQLGGDGSKQISDLDGAIRTVEDVMRKELLLNIESIDDESKTSPK